MHFNFENSSMNLDSLVAAQRAAGAGVKGIDASRGVSFDFPVAAYQAAMDGLGVALGRHPLVAPDLKAGRLVVPFDFKMSSEFAYYLVYPQDAIRRRKIKAFRDWLMPLADLGPRSA